MFISPSAAVVPSPTNSAANIDLSRWSPALSAEIYKVDGWGAPYFTLLHRQHLVGELDIIGVPAKKGPGKPLVVRVRGGGVGGVGVQIEKTSIGGCGFSSSSGSSSEVEGGGLTENGTVKPGEGRGVVRRFPVRGGLRLKRNQIRRRVVRGLVL